MKVIKAKRDNITLDKLAENFGDYIIVADKLYFEKDGTYVLMAFNNTFTWINIRTNSVWGENNTLRAALQQIKVEDLYAFENYIDFAQWLIEDVY